ncbi:anti-sigma factor [Actinomadura sp. NAK00032]|uniref:anti-sigma factor n=1 Tax=Actinomadura sp. NAK00032 TaxID=2742128 RepID=UPI001591F468|nr:anti-sigma factor [Actinomadura sp. NAK00032]QKW36913.1 anti-sigma factor [Actinomadura sp. NAK00032]
MTHDPHDLAGAYALDALPDTERRRFQRHLPGCQACADEVTGLRETTARLALAASRRPPPALRDRVLAEIGRTRQSPPRLTRRLPPAPGRGLSWLAAAACLLLALAGGITAARFQGDAERARDLNRRIAAVMTAPDARSSTARTQDGATVTVVSSRSLDEAVITTSRLKRLPAAKTYQLWFLAASAAPRPGGVLRPPADRPSRPIIASGLGNARQIAMTVEPAGGSARPSTDPFLTLPLA